MTLKYLMMLGRGWPEALREELAELEAPLRKALLNYVKELKGSIKGLCGSCGSKKP